jgi:pteridine reductase
MTMTARERPAALITGAARRVGRAVAVHLARAGHDIIIHYNRSEAPAREAAGEIEALGRRAHLVQGDLALPSEPQRIVAAALQAAGRLDALVNNASVFEPMALEEFDVESWHKTMHINLAAPILLIRHAAAALAAAGGCVVNFCDICTNRPWKNYLAYGPSKAGLDYVTKALARALAPDVRVNGVAPGIALFPESYSAELRGRLVDKVPLKRPGTPEDMARAVCFLVESRYITGQIINVDGGRSIV